MPSFCFSVSVPKEDTIPRPVCKAGPGGDLQPHRENVRLVQNGKVRFSGSRGGLCERQRLFVPDAEVPPMNLRALRLEADLPGFLELVLGDDREERSVEG